MHLFIVMVNEALIYFGEIRRELPFTGAYLAGTVGMHDAVPLSNHSGNTSFQFFHTIPST
jgi:hypothetical protein